MNETANVVESRFRVLFISHNATRSGAPILLLSLLKWIRAQSPFEFDILLRESGELLEDFEQVGKVFQFEVLAPPMPNPTLARKVWWKIKTKDFGCSFSKTEWERYWQERYQSQLFELLRTRHYSIIYSNTVTNGEVIKFLAPLKVPLITHAHELEDVIYEFRHFWEFTRSHTDHFIAASNAVKDNLVENHFIDSKAISVVHTFVPDIGSFRRGGDRHSLGLPKDRFLVCACGTGEWRKGPDLFILLAERLCRLFNREGFHFCWIGGWATEQDERRAMALVRKLELKDKFTFTGVVDDTHPYFSNCDVFAMVSREDPFPIVCLEAAFCGLPILCFDKAGGIPEFVEEDAGFVVPFCDVQIMAERIHQLSLNAELRETLGSRAREKVLQSYTSDIGAKRITNVIDRVLHSKETEQRPATEHQS